MARPVLTAEDKETLQRLVQGFVFDVLGLKPLEDAATATDDTVDKLMELILEFRQRARTDKDWATADIIRDRLKEMNIEVKDSKEGATWDIS